MARISCQVGTGTVSGVARTPRFVTAVGHWRLTGRRVHSPSTVYCLRVPTTRAIAIVILLLPSSARSLPILAQDAPSTAWLQSFVGVWATEDTYYPVSGQPIVERAVRTCELVMRGSYLQCESVVTRGDGRDRTYRFLLNYNRTMSRFEMLSLWSNVPHKVAQVLTPDAARRRWRVENLVVIGDLEAATHWSELVFDSDDRIVWTGRRVAAGGDPASAPISFVEAWRRVP